MNWFKHIAHALGKHLFAASDWKNPELNGSVLTVYHRTHAEQVAEDICNIGFIAGGGAMYGRGIYTTYTLGSSLRNYNLKTYGGVIIKGQVDISGFLIFDYLIAKQVYGDNYQLVDQIKNVIGVDKVLNMSSNDETIRDSLSQLESYSKRLEKGGYTSETAHAISARFGLEKSGVPGILFTGHNDGHVCVVYKEAAVLPVAHAWIDGNSYKNPQWNECPQQSREELEKLQEDAQAQQRFQKDRKKLISTLASLKGKTEGIIDIPKANFPAMPDAIFDQLISNFIYADERRIKRLSPELQTRLKDIIEVDFLIRKLKSEPTVYWKDWQAVSDDVKQKIPTEMLVQIWLGYLQRQPGRWEDIPKEMRDLVPKDSEAKHWSRAVKKNEANWAYVPAEIQQFMLDNNMVKPPAPQQGGGEEVDLEETDVYEIPSGAVSWVENEINKMNRRAAKLGMAPLQIEILGEDRLTRVKKIRIIGNVPILKGWQLIAKIMPFRDESGKQVNNIEQLTDEDFPEEYQTSPPKCEHCNLKRNRKKLYILKNVETGEFKSIGSTCLGDFLEDASGTPNQIAAYAEKLQDMLVSFRNIDAFGDMDEVLVRKKFQKFGVPVPFYLSRVMVSQRAQGFLGRKKAREQGGYATADTALKMCYDAKFDEQNGGKDVSAADVAFVEDSMNWIAETPQPSPGENDFLWNINAAVAAGKVGKRNAGIVAWLPVVYKRHLDKEGQSKTDFSQTLGDVGNVVVLKGELRDSRPIFIGFNAPGEQHRQNYIAVADESRKQIVTWVQDTDLDAQIGEYIAVQGTVAGYTGTPGNHTTALTNVRRIDDAEYQQQIGQTDAQMQAFHQSKQRGAAPAAQPVQAPVTTTPTEYNHGERIEQDFTVVFTKPTRFGNFFVLMKDPAETVVTTFSKQDRTKGETIRLRGTVEIGTYRGKPSITLKRPTIVQPPAQPAPVQPPPAQPGQQPAQPPAQPKPDDDVTNASNNWWKRAKFSNISNTQ